MTCIAWLLCALFGAGADPSGPLKWERIKISDELYEASSVCDINKDGKLDLVSGAWWYAGPQFRERHKMCDVKRESEYWDDFSDYPMDVNGDGYVDIVTGGWFGQTLQWRENPKGGTGPWTVHDIDKAGNIETIRYWDIDGDGQVETVPNAGDRVAVYSLVRDAAGKGTGKFDKKVLKQGGCGHALGYGDVNGDGRGDFLVASGWIEQPAQGLKGEWAFHDEWKFGLVSVPVLVHDVNGDKLPDVIVGEGHNYGVGWYRQGKDAAGKRTWAKETIDKDRAQYHDLMLVDIDNDKQLELVTGKRHLAHNGHDPGEQDPLGVYYFEINGGKFQRVTLDYGPAERTAGVGLYFWVQDVDGNGWPDVLAPGKSGLYLFKNHGPAKTAPSEKKPAPAAAG